MKKIHSLLLVTCLLPLLSTLAQENEDKWWDHELKFDTLPPEQDPPWAFRGRGGLPVLENDKLILTTADEAQSIAYVIDENAAHEVLTVEFRVKAKENHSQFAGQFNIAMNGKVYVFPITNTDELTYRAVLDNGTMTLYREGDSPVTVKGIPDVRSKMLGQLLFGDASSSAVGTTEWSRLRWTWEKAVPAP